ncbi:MAG: hypothetical protein AB7G93_00945 [Bdellovibrionales bacterium]
MRTVYWLVPLIAALNYFLLGFLVAKAFAGEARVIRLSESTTAKIQISTRGTVLNFPAKPTKVILGRSGTFGIEYVENDLAISPLSLSAQSNLFVYVLGRRFAFELSVSPSAGSSVIQVRDAIEKKDKAEKK